MIFKTDDYLREILFFLTMRHRLCYSIHTDYQKYRYQNVEDEIVEYN